MSDCQRWYTDKRAHTHTGVSIHIWIFTYCSRHVYIFVYCHQFIYQYLSTSELNCSWLLLDVCLLEKISTAVAPRSNCLLGSNGAIRPIGETAGRMVGWSDGRLVVAVGNPWELWVGAAGAMRNPSCCSAWACNWTSLKKWVCWWSVFWRYSTTEFCCKNGMQ